MTDVGTRTIKGQDVQGIETSPPDANAIIPVCPIWSHHCLGSSFICTSVHDIRPNLLTQQLQDPMQNLQVSLVLLVRPFGLAYSMF